MDGRSTNSSVLQHCVRDVAKMHELCDITWTRQIETQQATFESMHDSAGEMKSCKVRTLVPTKTRHAQGWTKQPSRGMGQLLLPLRGKEKENSRIRIANTRKWRLGSSQKPLFHEIYLWSDQGRDRSLGIGKHATLFDCW